VDLKIGLSHIVSGVGGQIAIEFEVGTHHLVGDNEQKMQRRQMGPVPQGGHHRHPFSTTRAVINSAMRATTGESFYRYLTYPTDNQPN